MSRSAEVRKRQHVEQELVELAGLSRPAALRVFRERLAEVTAQREKLTAEQQPVPAQPAAGASMDDHVRHATATYAAEMNQRMDAQLAPL